MIRYDAFTKRFGTRTAVDGLSLEVAKGEAMALLGPNGSGKTTSLKGAAGLVRPSSGRVQLGDPPLPADRAENRAVASYLPQKVAFPEVLTAREVVTFFARLRRSPERRALDVLDAVALGAASDQPIGTYSGGMVQRLGLAVALLPDAPVLLLDEPTAALDPDGLCAFYGLVERRRREGKTVLFTSHQLGDVERLADRVAILVGGSLVASFSQRELGLRLADRGVMRLRVASRPVWLLERLRQLAPRVTWSGDELVVPGPAAIRPAIIDVVRAAGCEIVGLTADEGRLDTLYRELVNEAA